MGDPGKGKPHQHDGSGRTRPREAARNGLDADAEQRVLQDDLTTGNSSLAGCRVRGEEGERQVRVGVGVDTKSSVRTLTDLDPIRVCSELPHWSIGSRLPQTTPPCF